nr:HAD-IA family hydrolase [Streptomyces ruber]
MTEVARLEREAGLPEGSTAAVGYAPEVDMPLLLGRITKTEWEDAIADNLASRVSLPTARTLARAFADADFWADGTVVDLLRQARKHCPLILVTNATAWLDQDLAQLGLTDLADAIVNSSQAGIAKPDLRIYKIAAQQAGAQADRCLFIDDRQENIDAAIRLGMTGILYRRLADLRTALAPLLRPATA